MSRTVTRVTASGLVLGLGAAAVATALLTSTSATAAAPKRDYHPGTDTATFTATGVLDRNCLVSVGGNTVWIRPGDGVKFRSSLAGVDAGRAAGGVTVKTKSLVGGLLGTATKIVTTRLTGQDIAGLNITATLDPGSASAHRFRVSGGHPVTIRSPRLGSGDHRIRWTATGLSLAPGLVGKLAPGQSASIPLSSSALRSGAKLSWSGVVHVVSTAPQCTLAVSTPTVRGKVGKLHVKVPGTDASVPGTLPGKVPSLGNGVPGGGSATSSPAGPRGGSGGGIDYTPPSLTVPEEVVPQGGSDATYGAGGADSSGASSAASLDNGVPADNAVRSSPGGALSTPSASASENNGRIIDAASSGDGVGNQLPVILAIVAVVALTLVAATYARLFLLGRGRFPFGHHKG